MYIFRHLLYHSVERLRPNRVHCDPSEGANMGSILYPVLLLLVDGIALGLGIYYKRKYEQEGRDDGVPVSVLVTAASIALGVHLLLTLGWFTTLEPHSGTLVSIQARNMALSKVFFGSMVLGGPATVFYARLFVKGFAHASVDKAFGINTALAQETDFSKAKALYLKGDTEGALRMCKDYYGEEPSTPRALFEAERILTKEHRPEEAADILRIILRSFKDHEAFWVRAAFRMADIQGNDFDDRKAANFMLSEIEKRVPNTDDGILARRRQAQVWDAKGGQSGPDVS